MLSAIGRLKRAQPRNPDTMLVCDELERLLVRRLGDVVPVESGGVAMVQPILNKAKFDRAAYQREYMRKRRAGGKA